MPQPPPSSLPDTPFPSRAVAAVAAVAEALMTPAYWTLDRLLALRPTTGQRSRWRRRRCGHFLAVAIRVLAAPALVLALVAALPPAVLGLLLWLPAQAERRPFVHQFSAAAAAPEPWDGRCPRGLTFLTANVCLLPSGLARFSNLGGTGRRAEVIGRILAAAERSGDRDGLLDARSGRGGGYGGTLSAAAGPGVAGEGSARVSGTAWPEVAMGGSAAMVSPTLMVGSTKMADPTPMGDQTLMVSPTPMVNPTPMVSPTPMTNTMVWPEMEMADPTPMTNPTMSNPTMSNPTMTNPWLMTNAMSNPTMTNPSLMTNPLLRTNAMTNPTMTNPTMTNPLLMTNAMTNPSLMTNPLLRTNAMSNPTMTNPTMTNPWLMTNAMTNPTMTNTTQMTNAMSNPTMTNPWLMTNAMTNPTMTNPTQMTNTTTTPTTTTPSPLTTPTPRPERPERPISLADPLPAVLTARIPPDVDFLCLQEVFDVAAAAVLRRHLGGRFPHLLWGVGPAGLRRGRLRPMGSGLLLASRFPLLTASFRPFPQAAREDALANKGLLVAQVLLGTGRGRRVVGYLGCTHLQATAADATIRDAQLSLSLRWLKDFRRQQEQPGDLVAFDVLCGDLNFDNCSRGDAQNQRHPLFRQFWDPARRDRGQEQPWAIGTLLNYLKIYEEPVSDPERMRRTLSEPWGRQQFLAAPILPCGDNDPSASQPWSGRRVDMVLLRRDPQVTTEVTRYSVITRLATLSDHLPVAVRLRVGPADR